MLILTKRFFCRILIVTIFLVNTVSLATVHAEIRTYEGMGLFAVVDESLDYAKKQAKLNAERHIAEEVYADLQTDSRSKDGKLEYDEIILMTEGMMKIIDVNYNINSSEDGSFIVRAVVTAIVDTDEVEEILKHKEEK